jgi:hypothetical protein
LLYEISPVQDSVYAFALIDKDELLDMVLELDPTIVITGIKVSLTLTSIFFVNVPQAFKKLHILAVNAYVTPLASNSCGIIFGGE